MGQLHKETRPCYARVRGHTTPPSFVVDVHRMMPGGASLQVSVSVRGSIPPGNGGTDWRLPTLVTPSSSVSVLVSPSTCLPLSCNTHNSKLTTTPGHSLRPCCTYPVSSDALSANKGLKVALWCSLTLSRKTSKSLGYKLPRGVRG